MSHALTTNGSLSKLGAGTLTLAGANSVITGLTQGAGTSTVSGNNVTLERYRSLVERSPTPAPRTAQLRFLLVQVVSNHCWKHESLWAA